VDLRHGDQLLRDSRARPLRPIPESKLIGGGAISEALLNAPDGAGGALEDERLAGGVIAICRRAIGAPGD